MYSAFFAALGPFATGLRADGNAVPGGIAGVAAVEAQKRQERVTAAQTLFTAGSKAYSDQSYAEAMDYFKAAFETIPDVPAVADQRLIFFKRYQAAAYQYAVILAEEAKWAESEQTLADVVALAESSKMEKAVVEPGVRKMLDDLRNFDDRYNMAATPQHLRAVNTVESKLILGKGYLELGDYDRAERAFNEALAVDPFNTAARRGLESVERHRWNYYDAATDHTRARALAEVAAGWESPVRVPLADSNTPISMDGVAEGGGASIERKLKDIVIPQVELENARLIEVVEFLSQKAQELDNSESDPQRRGVNIVIDSSGLAGGEDAGQRILSVKLSNIPLGIALKYAAQQVGMVYRTDNFAVRVISELADDGGTLIARRYVVPPGFISGGAESPAAGPVDPFASATPGAGPGAMVERISPQQFLEGRGVVFGPGSSVSFIAATNSLIVRNTSQQLQTIESIVQAARDTAPKNVEIRVKIVSIESETLKLLGLDYLLGQSSLINNSVLYSGGTNGNAADPINQADYPFAGVGGPIGMNPVTSGLRMGSLGSNPSIEDVIANGIGGGTGITNRAAGVFSVAGVLTDPQFQVVLRALDQAKGSDLLSDAHVTVKPGQLARIEVVREFIYPTEYDPPEIPQITAPPPPILTDDDDGGPPLPPAPPGFIPVTPATPTAFESRRLGKVIEVEPTVAADNKTVSVNVLLDFTEFIGFINYGTRITGGTGVLTENEILMPVFDALKETTNVTVWDGQTIAIGGFHGESIASTHDKIPGLGDLPVIGRGFRSTSSKSSKRAVTIFLTVNLIDPGGNPINLPIEETTEYTVPPRFDPSGGLQSGPPPALPYPAK